ncbi:MAG: hypothetical protein K2Z80_22850 [Xanthobacteraceae bacterium]|nr:hypothetical protein [Xanthobacteraceae bacterium]
MTHQAGDRGGATTSGKTDDDARWRTGQACAPFAIRDTGSARGQMQKLPSVGKFHLEPPSPFTSLDHLVGVGEQRGRPEARF